MTITEAFELYRDDFIVPKNQSAKTEENHFICQDALVHYFGDIDIEQLTRANIRQWRINLAKTRSDATVRNYVIKLRVVLGYLYKEGYKVVEPENIQVPQRSDPKVRYLTPEQVQLFIDACGEVTNNRLTRARNKAIVSLLYSAGIRVSELCGLDVIDVQGREFFATEGKGGVVAPSFIDARSKKLINTYLRMRSDNQKALFISEQGNRIRPLNVQEFFCNLSDHVGIKATPHTLKHSFCTNLMANGADIRYVQRLAKHKSIQTTETYLHVLDNDLQRLHAQYHSVS